MDYNHQPADPPRPPTTVVVFVVVVIVIVVVVHQYSAIKCSGLGQLWD